MENIKIQKLKEDRNTRKCVSDIFVDAYYKDLSSLSKDKAKLSDAFYNSFLLTNFYGAFVNDKFVGIFALSAQGERSIRLTRKDFIRNFGFLKGLISFFTMRKDFEHPINLRKKGYLIEAVGTKVKHQGQGIGRKMMQYAIENNDYLELEVVDTNISAVKLYEKLGFKIFKEVPEKYFKKAKGFNKRIFMYYEKGDETTNR